MPFFCQSGQEVMVGDHVLIHGAEGLVELVADPAIDSGNWHVQQDGIGGFMILCPTILLGRVFITPPVTDTDHLEFRSRGIHEPQ